MTPPSQSFKLFRFIRDKRIFAAVGLALLVGLGAAGYALAQKKVEISVDGKILNGKTFQKTVGGALAQAGVVVGEKDRVTPGLQAPLSSQSRVDIKRAVEVYITADDKRAPLLTSRDNVAEALREAGIGLGDEDVVKPGLTSPIIPSLEIAVERFTQETRVVQETIAFATARREDPSLELGQDRVVQAGEDGLKELTVKVVKKDGKEVKSEVVGEKVLKEPTTRMIAYGTVGVVSRGGQTLRFKRALTMTATAYTAGVESNPWATGYTYLGMKATRGVVAVDPRVIPLRSRLYIEGYGYAIAGDIGGAIKGNRIDLAFDSVKEAYDFGVRQVKVYVLE